MSANLDQAKITVEFYTGNREFNWQRLRKTFLLNAQEDSARLQRIVDEIAQELHYLSGYGIEAIRVDSPRLKFTTQYDTQYIPYHKGSRTFFRALRFLVGRTEYRRRIWFDIPRIDVFTFEHPTDDVFPIQVSEYGYGKRRKKKGYSLKYDRNDPYLVSFLQKISDHGVLSLAMRSQLYPIAHVSELVLGTLPKSQTSQYIGEQNRKKAQKEAQKRQRLEKAGIIYKEKTRKEKANQVYVIQMDESEVSHVYKIGISNAPGKRLQALQTSSPFTLRIVHTFVAEPAEDAEAHLHTKFQESNLNGEWFRLTPNQITELKQISEYKNGEFIKKETQELNKDNGTT